MNTYYQHILSTHILSTHIIWTHIINTYYQHILSTHIINTYNMNTYYQHILSTHTRWGSTPPSSTSGSTTCAKCQTSLSENWYSLSLSWLSWWWEIGDIKNHSDLLTKQILHGGNRYLMEYWWEQLLSLKQTFAQLGHHSLMAYSYLFCLQNVFKANLCRPWWPLLSLMEISSALLRPAVSTISRSHPHQHLSASASALVHGKLGPRQSGLR